MPRDDDEITRDRFSCAYDRFYAGPHRVERVSGPSLRSAFLPNLSAGGRKMLSQSYSDSFVRGQLEHYGVQFGESEISRSEQMHAEWLAILTPAQLSSHPEWTMERYFVSAGRPDRSKTATTVGIPLDPGSSYRAGQMREAASAVPGLHHETSYGSKTQTIFMGWDAAAVSKAAKGHAAKEAKECRAVKDEKESEHRELHAEYIESLKRKKGPEKPKPYSRVGSYITCQEIEEQWPEQGEDLGLDIRQTKEAGVFEASFDFGILEEVMILGTDEKTVEQYCSQLDRWDEETETKRTSESGLNIPRAPREKPPHPAVEAARPRRPRPKLPSNIHIIYG
ncbi:hypothetical protein B2J93_1366 [Marssonina coronariae]|uniref:Uncharacterized protein n=1 Tax=Diplocarpon coronariae TaxID=2795749 RepID=A0A218Z8W7_9HELO|nr:hypothetical protein B2J93_1366 [Marssonina coronariae]